jgi:hypothetical protein
MLGTFREDESSRWVAYRPVYTYVDTCYLVN